MRCKDGALALRADASVMLGRTSTAGSGGAVDKVVTSRALAAYGQPGMLAGFRNGVLMWRDLLTMVALWQTSGGGMMPLGGGRSARERAAGVCWLAVSAHVRSRMCTHAGKTACPICPTLAGGRGLLMAVFY